MGGGENNEVSEEFVGLTDNIEPHPEKGGIKLTGYLTYNCLSINEDASQVNIFMISVKPRNIFQKNKHHIYTRWGYKCLYIIKCIRDKNITSFHDIKTLATPPNEDMVKNSDNVIG